MIVITKMGAEYDGHYVHFLNPLLRFASIFTAIPMYDYQKLQLKNVKLYKYYVFLWILVVMISLITFVCRVNVVLLKILPSFLVLVFKGLIFLKLTTCLVTAWESFANRNSWNCFVNSLYSLEYESVSLTRNIKKISLWKISLPQVSCCLIFATFLILNGYFFYIVMRTNSHDIVTGLTTATFFIMYFQILWLALTLSNIILYLNVKFHDINQLLEESVQKNRLFVIRRAANMFLKMDEIVTCFNGVFQYRILFFVVSSAYEMLVDLSWVSLILSKKADSNPTNTDDIFTTSIFYGICSFVRVAIIMLCCETVLKEAKKSVAICYRLQQEYEISDEEHNELQNLVDMLYERCPKFTAANFFELNRSTVFSLIGTITTYFIVVLQLIL